MEALLTLFVETSTTKRGGRPVEASFFKIKLFTSERSTFFVIGTRTTTPFCSRSTLKLFARSLLIEPRRTTLGPSPPVTLICSSLSLAILILYCVFSDRSTTIRSTLYLSTPQLTSVTKAAAEAVQVTSRQTAQTRNAKNFLRKPVPPLCTFQYMSNAITIYFSIKYIYVQTVFLINISGFETRSRVGGATRLPLLSVPRIAPLSAASLVDWDPSGLPRQHSTRHCNRCRRFAQIFFLHYFKSFSQCFRASGNFSSNSEAAMPTLPPAASSPAMPWR